MANIDIKQHIKQSIQACSNGNLTQKALSLFKTLGYNTERQAQLDKPTFATFKDSYIDRQSKFNEEKALTKEWEYVDLLFQLSKEEVQKTASLFDTKQVDRTVIETYLFFVIELAKDRYTRTELSLITREVNRLFPMPAMILFKHGQLITLSVIDRRLHKRDESKDVLEKVTLIKDISIVNPHLAHILILFDLSFDELQRKIGFTNFVELHNAWKKTLDTKELNKRFFQELANWYFWALQNVEFPEDAEKNKDVRNAISVIRMITRLIFIWFVKEKGLIPDELFNQTKLKSLLNLTDKNQSTYYKAILQNLFFATLNTEMNKDKPGSRKFRGKNKGDGRDQHYMIHNVFRYEDYFTSPQDTLKKYFENIPFLNGGLFECLDKDVSPTSEKGGEGGFSNKKVIRIDGFSDHPKNGLKVPDYLFFSSEQPVDLNEIYGTKNKTYKVRGLIDILDSYKFTVDENTPIEEEIALDPELLGKVFENLLASFNPETQTTARKQTGSFYTPREIVNYMVDESIIAYLTTALERHSRPLLQHSGAGSGGNPENPPSSPFSKGGEINNPTLAKGGKGGFEESFELRLRHLIEYNYQPHEFIPAEVDVLIAAINTLKVLDPACGSGAFPMGMLHKLVYILGKLDPDNSKWRELQKEKAIRETEEAYKIGDKEEREKRLLDISEVFENNASDYGRKLYLIENCIFGVDIQPIAVQIAKLRFFVSLIVDQRIDPKKENLGVRPLPNLETKFVAANTLIGIEKPAQMMLRNPEIDRKEKELKKVRERHFTARTPQTKQKYRKEDERLRAEISELLKKDGFPRETTEKLARWNPYDQNTSANFFDSEWMFGVTEGFDVVIGNPPYVLMQAGNRDDILNQYYRQHYKVASYKLDLYHLFIEQGVKVLNGSGTISLIIPSNFTSNNFSVQLRRYLLTETAVEKLVFFAEGVFDASVHNLVFVAHKLKPADALTSFCQAAINGIVLNVVEKTKIKQAELVDDMCLLVPRIGNAPDGVVRKMAQAGESFGSVASVNFGMQLRDRSEFKQDVVESPAGKVSLTKYHRECYTGKDIHRFYVAFANRYCYFNKVAKRGGCWDEDIHNAKGKILVRQIGDYPQGGLDTYGYAVLNSAFMILPKNRRFDCKFLLGVLNSAALRFYWLNKFRDDRKTFPKIKGEYLKLLPLPNVDSEKQAPIIVLVAQILAAKKKDPNADTSALEKQIDEMVYALYGLTPEEIAIVEGKK